MKTLKATAPRAFPLTAAYSWVFKSRPKKLKNARSPHRPWRGGLPLFCVALLTTFFLSGCGQPQAKQEAAAPDCTRMVSFSPSITEIVYALGLENNLVGVTRYCKYPAAAQKKTSVGGYLDPNIEAVIRLRPTLVLLRQEQHDIRGRLANFNRPTLSVEHRNEAGILQSFRQIGQACHREAEAERQLSQLQGEINTVTKKITSVKTRPSVLVVVDRDIRYNTIKNIFVPAHDGFYDWLITEAGGKNAMTGNTPGFSEISTEGILRINPDVIIEINPSLSGSSLPLATIQKAWHTMPSLNAVKNHRIYLFTNDYMSIPGPRFVKTLRQFAETLHPELDWTKNG
jgi:iron complex transport system substrate-binding protein